MHRLADFLLPRPEHRFMVRRARVGARHPNAEIPEGWGLDAEGQPTSDATTGLKGSMVPLGGYKGMGVGLMVELFGAALTGAELGIDAAPISSSAGRPPPAGQFLIAPDPQETSDGHCAEQLNRLVEAVAGQAAPTFPAEGGWMRAPGRMRTACDRRCPAQTDCVARRIPRGSRPISWCSSAVAQP